MFRGIVFDLDGTLLDSKLCFDSIRKQLEIPHGKLILEYLEKIPTAQRTIKHKILHEIELNAAKSAPLFPGVATFINALNASGIKLGIFTRNNRQVTEWVVNQYRLPSI
ncbi:MAG: HAD hydrolase-like protein [Bdellovibrionota bacterium]